MQHQRPCSEPEYLKIKPPESCPLKIDADVQ